MLFDFFKKPSKSYEKYEEEVVAKISYVVFANSNSPMVDVEIDSYDDYSIKSLSKIIDILSDNRSIIDTIEIIKAAMIDDNNSDSVIKFFSYLDQKTKNNLMESYHYSDNDQPCIKPSEAFLK